MSHVHKEHKEKGPKEINFSIITVSTSRALEASKGNIVQDISGDIFEERADGLLARVLQHEIDHLRGVLFIDRISSMKRQLLNKKLKAIADAEKELMAEVA